MTELQADELLSLLGSMRLIMQLAMFILGGILGSLIVSGGR